MLEVSKLPCDDLHSHLTSAQKCYSGKKWICVYRRDLLLPNDHICLLLIEAQKRPCSLINSSHSPLFFAKKAGINLRAGDSIPSLSKHLLLPKALCGLRWVDVGFHDWIHGSGQILPSAVRVQEQSWAGWVCACFRVEFALDFLEEQQAVLFEKSVTVQIWSEWQFLFSDWVLGRKWKGTK